MGSEPQFETVKYAIGSVLFTLVGLFAVVSLSTNQIRSSARIAVLSALRVTALGFGSIIIGIVYIPILILDKMDGGTSKGEIRAVPTSKPRRRRRRYDSDVSDLDLGEAQFCLERGLYGK